MANGTGAPVAYINARLIDPLAGTDQPGSLLVGADGKIADFGPSLFACVAPWGFDRV
jgi:dihydroorotase